MLVALFFCTAALIFYRQLTKLPSVKSKPKSTLKAASPRLAADLDYADRLLKERKYLLAEKAYLQIIKSDHKSALAYTKLGMVYSKLKNFEDAKECFVIASQLDPSASTFHNLGLVYLESRNTIKAIAAFEKSLIFESTASRYIDLAKAYQKLSNSQKVTTNLEKAVELEPSKTNLWLLAGAYKSANNHAQAQATLTRILELDPSDARASHALGPHQPEVAA